MKKIFPNLISVRQHQKIICPDCNCKMTAYLCESAVIDKCDQCGGIWFDKNELTIFQQSIKKYDLRELMADEGLQAISGRYQISDCPRCQQPLVEQVQGAFKKVHLQCCTKCQGQWLKSNELIQLVDLLKLHQEIAPHVSGVREELGKVQREVEFDKKIKCLGDKYGGNLYDQAFTAKRPHIALLSNPNTTNVTWILLALSVVGGLINAFLFPINITGGPFDVLKGRSFYQIAQFCWHFFSSYSFLHFTLTSVFFVLFAQAAEKKLGSYRFFIMVCITPLFLLAHKVISLLWGISGDPVGLGVFAAGSMGALLKNPSDFKIEGGFNSYYYQVSAAFLTLVWFFLQFLMLDPINWSVEWTSQCFAIALWFMASLLVPQE